MMRRCAYYVLCLATLIGGFVLACDKRPFAAFTESPPRSEQRLTPWRNGAPRAVNEELPWWGVGLHMGGILHDVETLRPTLRELGVDTVRVDLYWSRFEATRDKFGFPPRLENLVRLLEDGPDWGLRSIAILNYGNPLYFDALPTTEAERAAFLRYVREVARRYGATVAAFELWNEWNIGYGAKPREPGSASDYVALLKRVRPLLREHAPSVPLIAGAVANRDMTWIRAFIEQGGLALCDGFSVHPYNFADRDASAEEVIRWLDGLRDELHRHRKVPIHVTEIGWPNHRGRGGSSEEGSAVRLLKLMLLSATRPYLASVVWYDLVDDGADPTNKEFHFGLLRRDGSRKPAFEAYQGFSRTFRGARFVRALEHDQATVLEFVDAQERRVVAAWSSEQAERLVLDLEGAWEPLPVSPDAPASLPSLKGATRASVGPAPLIFVLSKGGSVRVSRGLERTSP